MSITFDTLDYARKLESVGVPIAQAELQSKFLAEVLEKSFASQSGMASLNQGLNAKIDSVDRSLITKIDAFGLALESRIDKLENGLNAKIGLLCSEVKLVKGMLGILLVINIAVALKTFMH